MFTLPDPSSLPAEPREEARQQPGETRGTGNGFPPPRFLLFPRTFAGFAPSRVRKPTDGTVLFLEELSLAGGQAGVPECWKSIALQGSFPVQGHRKSLPVVLHPP